jgi:hypothetical protein
MAGPTERIAYDGDEGTTRALLVPTWQVQITGDAPLASGPGGSAGFKRRRRFIIDDATGKEHGITVGSITSAAWTAAFGSAVAMGAAVAGQPAGTFKYGGRTGERTLVRG